MVDSQFAASDVSSADLDVARATSELTDRLKRLYSHIRIRKNAPESPEGMASDVDSEISSLQRLARDMSSVEFISHMKSWTAHADAAARGDFPAVKSKHGFVLSTSSMPLSMYCEKIWQISFPKLGWTSSTRVQQCVQSLGGHGVRLNSANAELPDIERHSGSETLLAVA